MGDENKPRRNFVPVTKTHKVPGGARRKPASVLLSPSGRVLCNASGGELMAALVAANKLDVNNVGMKFSADEVAELVAGYAVVPGTLGAMPVSRNDGVVTTHMGNVFEEYPLLRPAGERMVRVSLELQETPPYILFSLQTATVKSHKTGDVAPSGAEQVGKPAAGRAKGQKTAKPPVEAGPAAGDDKKDQT